MKAHSFCPGKFESDPVICGDHRRVDSRIELRVGVGARMQVMRMVIDGERAAAEYRQNAKVQVAGADRDSRFSLSTDTSNAKGER